MHPHHRAGLVESSITVSVVHVEVIALLRIRV